MSPKLLTRGYINQQISFRKNAFPCNLQSANCPLRCCFTNLFQISIVYTDAFGEEDGKLEEKHDHLADEKISVWNLKGESFSISEDEDREREVDPHKSPSPDGSETAKGASPDQSKYLVTYFSPSKQSLCLYLPLQFLVIMNVLCSRQNIT